MTTLRSSLATDMHFAEEIITGVAKDIAAATLTESEIAGIIADLFVDQGGFIVDVLDRARVFNFSEPVANTDAQCTISFARSFQHTDWVDGESVVQAEQSTFEDGFNTRFHRIEDDLDRLGADLALVFACVAELRSGTATALGELRSEVNRINEDIHECCNDDDSGGGFTFPGEIIQPGIVGTWKGNTIIDGNEFLVYENLGRFELVPKVEFDVDDTIFRGGDVVFPGGGDVVLPRDEDINLPGGGTINPGSGDVVLPGGGVVSPGGEVTNRINQPGLIARWLEADAEARVFIRSNSSFTAGDISEKFGHIILDEKTGLTVGEAIKVLPTDSAFTSPAKMVEMMVELESAVVRGSGDLDTLAKNLGVSNRRMIGSASISGLGMVTDKASAALNQAGINTIEDLAKLTPTSLTRALRNGGVTVRTGDAAGILANARTVNRIGQ